MVDPSKSRPPLDPEKRARLLAELKSPYRPLRQFIYIACAASGFFGGLIILSQLLAGRNVGTALPNFAIQVGVVALMVWLLRIDRSKGNS